MPKQIALIIGKPAIVTARPKAEKLEMAMIKSQKNLAKAIYIFFGPKMGLLTAF